MRAGVRGCVPWFQSVSVPVGIIRTMRPLSLSSYVDLAATAVTV
jgi:hypothetical protein